MKCAARTWLSGLVCLWLTRYTHQLAQHWSGRYYLASALVRPLGVLLTVVGWLAVLEDRELAAHFGAEYAEYVRRVPRLFPN